MLINQSEEVWNKAQCLFYLHTFSQNHCMFQPELLARGNCSCLDFWKWKRIAIVLKGVLRKSCIKVTRSMCNCVSPSMCMPMHVTERERAEKEKGKNQHLNAERGSNEFWKLRFFCCFFVFFSFASWKNADVVVSGTLNMNIRICNGVLDWS